jgi:hypothetical protein
VVKDNSLNHKPACRQAGDHEVKHKVTQREKEQGKKNKVSTFSTALTIYREKDIAGRFTDPDFIYLDMFDHKILYLNFKRICTIADDYDIIRNRKVLII